MSRFNLLSPAASFPFFFLLFMVRELSISWAQRTAVLFSPVRPSIKQGQMGSFTPFTAGSHQRTEEQRWETPRFPTAFLNAPLSYFPRLQTIA